MVDLPRKGVLESMANVNSPYGFRLWTRLVPGTGASSVAPGLVTSDSKSYGPDAMPSFGPVAFPSGATLSPGDPIKVSAGLGYLCAVTNAIYGILLDPVPEAWNPSSTKRHYPGIAPADDQSVWVVQSIGTTNVTAGMLGIPTKRYRLASSSTGHMGIDMSHSANGGSCGLLPIALAPIPGNAYGTYAQLLVLITRGAFYGQG